MSADLEQKKFFESFEKGYSFSELGRLSGKQSEFPEKIFIFNIFLNYDTLRRVFEPNIQRVSISSN